MQNLERFYTSVGSSASDIVGRLGGNVSLVTRFLAKFPSDTSFFELQKSLESGDTETAFRMAHTMKGLCANLGIQTLYDKASEVTELLRGGDLESAKASFPMLEKEYQQVLASLKEIGIN